MRGIIISQTDFLRDGEVSKKGEIFKGDIGVDCQASVDFKAVKISDDKIYICGKITGVFILECSRCLEKYKHPFEIKIDSDMDFFNGVIDLSEEIRQLLSLEIPMKPLCGENCLGICKICGKHNRKNDSCSCADGDRENFIKERWNELLTGGSKNAKSKKKTYAPSQR
ncbi:MAG: YceD family protein [Endomicrobium sp.]|jgi:uncharacterized protein|nr:YceD family protein [Endomicrobium sp.]